MNATKKVVSNSFYLFLMWGFSTLFGYFFWVFLANFLPKADVGIFSAALNLALFVGGLAFLGLNSAEVKLIPEYGIKKDTGKIGGTIRYVTKIIAVTNIMLALLVLAFARQLAEFYLNEVAFMAFAALMIVLSLSGITANHLYSLQKMRLFFLSETAASLGKLVFAAALIILGFGWLGAAGGVAFSFLAVSIIRLKWIPLRGGADGKEVWLYAVPAFLAGIGTILINQGSIVFLSFLADAASVGAFTIAFMFTTPIKIISQIISQAIFPVTSEEFASRQRARLKNLVAQSIRYSYFVSLPAALAFVLFAREFLMIFARNYVSATFAFQILAVAYLLFGLGTISTGVLYYAGKPKLNRDITLFSGIANAVMIFVLVPLLGIVGAALAFLVSGGMMFFAGLWNARKHIGMSLEFGSLLKILVSSGAFAAALMLFRLADFSGAAQVVWMLVSLSFASAAYLILLMPLRFFGGVDVRILEGVEPKVPELIKPIFSLILSMIKKHSSDKND